MGEVKFLWLEANRNREGDSYAVALFGALNLGTGKYCENCRGDSSKGSAEVR